MKIDANIKWGNVNGVSTTNRSAANPQTPVDSGDPFASSAALENSLKSSPDVRADAVARGKALVAKDGYPPDTTVKKLSDFLANKLQGQD